MKIVDIKTYVLSSTIDNPFAFSQGWVRTRNAMLTEVITDEGISGWGEALCNGLQPPQLAAAVVEYALKQLMIGKDPLDVEVLWDIMYNATKDYGQKGVVIGAISSIDIALWDIIGKYHKIPVYKALGGAHRTNIKAYATGFHWRGKESERAKAWIEEAEERISIGFQGIKIKVGMGTKADIANISAVREAIGQEPMIMIDANHAYDFTEARKIGLALGAYDINWFEEPLSPENIQGYRELKQAIPIPIACGENEYTRYGFKDWISTHSTDIIQPDVCHAGGLTECRRISAIASAWGVNYIPHCWGSAIGLAATLHLLAILPPNPMSYYPNEPLLEFDMAVHPFRNKIISKALQLDNGYVAVPGGYGLGIEVDREMISFYQVNK